MDHQNGMELLPKYLKYQIQKNHCELGDPVEIPIQLAREI